MLVNIFLWKIYKFICRQKNAKPLFHSDRGFQYTSKQFKFKVNQAGMIQSMSRVGRCIDKGLMEGFFGTLKSEMFYGLRWDEKSLREAIIKYINFFTIMIGYKQI